MRGQHSGQLSDILKVRENNINRLERGIKQMKYGTFQNF